MTHKLLLCLLMIPSFALAQKWISPLYALNGGNDSWVVIRNNPYEVRFCQQTSTKVEIMSGVFDTTTSFTFPLKASEGFNMLPFDVTGDGYNDVEIYDHSSHYTERIVNLFTGQDYLMLDSPSYNYELLLNESRPDIDNDGHVEIIFRRSPLPAAPPYYRQLVAYQTSGSSTSAPSHPIVHPTTTNLQQNFPNPFNPDTKIGFDLSTTSEVNIDIYDISGKIVRSLKLDNQSAGTHEITWDGRNARGVPLATGAYFYTLTVDGASITKKMLLLR